MLARHDEAWHAIWTGEHDAGAHLTISLSIAVYLALSSYLAAWIGEGLVVPIGPSRHT